MDDINLMFGDCLELMKAVPDSSVDMILADLPYALTHNKKDILIPFEPLWEQYWRIAKINACIALFAQGLFYVDLVNSQRKYFKYDLIWDKILITGFMNSSRQPLRQHEQIAIFYKKQPTYNPQFTVGIPNHWDNPHNYKNRNYNHMEKIIRKVAKGETKKYPKSILYFQKPAPFKALHRTQKPIALLEWLIRTYTNEGELVMDNVFGAGSTAIACINTNRKFIGMENDVKYFDIAKNEISKHKEPLA